MHNLIRRSVCLFLTLTLVFGTAAFPAAASDAEQTYTGDTLVAVNPNFSTSSKTEGSFTAQSELTALQSLRSTASSEEIFRIYRDPDTGERLYVMTPDLPELEPTTQACAAADATLPEAAASEHAAGEALSLVTKDRSSVSMDCLYIGTYCTVWGSTSDDAAVQLTAEQAQEIGGQFDSFFPDVTNAFGSYWYDADSDERVAIMCYDIDSDYGTSVSSYTAGYFYSVDMLGFDGLLNGIRFNNTPTNAMDCIHIDTYPLMGYGTPMSNIDNCFGTLVHEFQHMLNFSANIENSSYTPFMPNYLNEAFSMAAEHMICGADTTADRVSYFSSSKYVPGTSLTYWSSTLSNYANSYLFGQYLRTRYGALNGDDGSTLFKTVIAEHRRSPGEDWMSLLADLLDTTEQELITDFWCACYLREETGNWGFGGERWADSISPQVCADFSSTAGIYNSGAKYYTLTDDFTPASASSVTFVALTDPVEDSPAEPPVLTDLAAERLSLNEASITFTADQNGTLFYTLTSSAVTDKTDLCNELQIDANVFTTLWIDTLLSPDHAPTFYYFTETDGVQSDLQSIRVPPMDCHLSVLGTNDAELFIHSPSNGTAYLVLYDAQTGQMLELLDYTLSGTDVYQSVSTAHDLTVCKIKIFVLDKNGAPMRAAYQP